jgi:DNA-binding NarL/FixJ family response regulator
MNMNDSVSILIVDGDDVFRQTVCAQLENEDGLTVVGEARDAQSAIEQSGALEPDVILLGLNTLCPDHVQTVVCISERYPHSKILVLSNCDGLERSVLDVFRKGAQGYLNKGSSRMADIVEAVHTVSRGGAVLSPGVAGWILGEVSQMRRQSETNVSEGEQDHGTTLLYKLNQ